MWHFKAHSAYRDFFLPFVASSYILTLVLICIRAILYYLQIIYYYSDIKHGMTYATKQENWLNLHDFLPTFWVHIQNCGLVCFMFQNSHWLWLVLTTVKCVKYGFRNKRLSYVATVHGSKLPSFQFCFVGLLLSS